MQQWNKRKVNKSFRHLSFQNSNQMQILHIFLSYWAIADCYKFRTDFDLRRIQNEKHGTFHYNMSIIDRLFSLYDLQYCKTQYEFRILKINNKPLQL